MLDINECTDGTHHCDQICTNLDCQSGRYNCSCDSGYTLASDGHTCLGNYTKYIIMNEWVRCV